MMYSVWPTWFYVGEVKEHDKVVEAFLPYIESEEFFHHPWPLAKCKSSCQHPGNAQFPWDVWNQAIKPNLVEYMEGLNSVAPMSIDIVESWVNIYYRDGFQEIHDHGYPGRSISCSYFFEKDTSNDSGGELVFENMDYTTTTMSGLDRIFQGFQTKYFIPEVKPGTIVFLPSWIKHYTHPNTSDQRRVTFSASFDIAAS